MKGPWPKRRWVGDTRDALLRRALAGLDWETIARELQPLMPGITAAACANAWSRDASRREKELRWQAMGPRRAGRRAA